METPGMWRPNGVTNDLAAKARDDVMGVLRRTAALAATPEQAALVTMQAAGAAVGYLAGCIARAYGCSKDDAFDLALDMCNPSELKQWAMEPAPADSGAEADSIKHETNACPHCGGSGHRADVS